MNTLTKQHQDAIIALKTARGQIDGVIKMIEDSRYCIDISNQILAVQSQISRANKLILLQHLQSCVVNAASSPDDLQEKTDELSVIFDKILK